MTVQAIEYTKVIYYVCRQDLAAQYESKFSCEFTLSITDRWNATCATVVMGG